MAERQVPAAADNDHSNQTRSLAAVMGASLRRYWDERTGYQSFLYAAGVLLLASGLFHTLVFLVDGGGWDGPLSWRKPILFGFSFGITVLTLGWVLSFLPRRRGLGWNAELIQRLENGHSVMVVHGRDRDAALAVGYELCREA